MRKRVSQRMADVVAIGGSNSGSSETQREGPYTRARRMGEIVDEWESENGPRVEEEIYKSPLKENNEDDNDFADDTEGDSIRKRGRGRANRWEGWGKGKKIIEWDGKCNPIGENAAKLASHLGTYARNGIWFPLYWTSWDGMSKETLEMVWKDVKANTNAPDGFKKILFKKLNKSWKSFKYELKKKYYLAHDTDAQRLAVVPPEVKADQWPELVRYWSMESTQALSTRNTDNRRNLLAYPRIGRISIPSIVDKRRKVNEPTDPISIWRATRAKKGKYTDDDGAAEIEQTFQRRLDELPEEERDDPETRERIFFDVVGNDGHKGVLGGGIGTRSSSEPYEVSVSPIHDYEAEISQLREEATERARSDEERDRRDEERDQRHQEKIAELKAQFHEQIAEQKDQFHEQITELKDQFHEQIAELKAQLQVALRSTADSEARVIRMLQGARFSMILPSPSP